MADILIKGLALPKDGYIDIRIHSDGEAIINTGKPPYYESHEAVALPEHELISVHKVLDYLAERAETSKEMGDDETASLFASMGGDILAMSVEASNADN